MSDPADTLAFASRRRNPLQPALLNRVRKLLAKAEAEGVTPHEAEALTAKAAELMARYGIDRALLAANAPDTDKPADRVIDVDNPWAQVKSHLLTGLSAAMRCQSVLIPRRDPGSRVHVFGYTSDLERAEILYTSLLVQMTRALTAAVVPAHARSPRAWRRSWLLGFTSAVVARVQAAEARAAADSEAERLDGSPSTALVLADRSVTVGLRLQQAYPRTRTTRITYSGNGYQAGYSQGQRADIGGARVGRRAAPALTG
jgi:Protein of unknown function (DUF2786)